MKYMVLTAKHHDGFCLWDSAATDFTAVKLGPKRDLVQEYVDACRKAGLKVGLYYSLMDWHHPDGHACQRDEQARRRFVDYTYTLVEELMTRYGKIDILWYDVAWPLETAEAWESKRINAMVRKHQPHILINSRSWLPKDFSTPEGHIVVGSNEGARGWEACMTFNGAWGYMNMPEQDWVGAQKVLSLLNECTSGGENLLLNIGPKADGSVPSQAQDCLRSVGAWLKKYGEAVYQATDRVEDMEWMYITAPMIKWTRRDKTFYFWVGWWPGSEIAIGGLNGKVRKVGLIGGADSFPFVQESDRLIISMLSKRCPDSILNVAVLRFEFEKVPTQKMGAGCESLQQKKQKRRRSRRRGSAPSSTSGIFLIPQHQ